MKHLIIAAHPDDEVLGCGGTAALQKKRGDEIFISIFGEGETSRYERREEADPENLQMLHGDSRKAAKVLGAKDLFLYDFPDNRFDSVPLLDIIKKIEGLIQKLKPGVVYTQHGGDLNIDHSVLFRATMAATRTISGCPVKELYAYEVASSTEWAFQRVEPIFKPNTFVDISDTIDIKIEAMKVYASEIRDFPHPRSPEALRAISKRWGSVIGCNYAEAFELIRMIRS